LQHAGLFSNFIRLTWRIARAIADMALDRSEKTGQRFYSMSAQIRSERNDYYSTFEQTQKGTLDVTRWQS
jgi:Fic family protein